MEWRELAVEGAVEFSPQIIGDMRGSVTTPFHADAFTASVGSRLFPVAQTVHSRSRPGAARGIHFTAVPPGTAKYVYCPVGKVTDFVVDLRVGSPTFAQWDSTVLSAESLRAVYIPTGVGHAFVALEEAVVSYLMSAVYRPEREYAISLADSELDLSIPGENELVLSERDRNAPTVRQARRARKLPEYRESRMVERELLSRIPCDS